MNPLISVITVTYNAECTIKDTIESVIFNDYPNLEYIIIDGGSKDLTVEIIKKYNIKYISEKDDGIYDAMNKGIRIANGEFVYFLGSGDILLKESFSKFDLSGITSDTVYYGNVRYVPSNIVVDGEFNKWKIVRHNLPHQAILYPMSVFKCYEYNIGYRLFADYVLNIQLFGDKRFKFVYNNIVVADFLQGGASGTFLDYAFYNDRKKIIIKNLGYHYYLWYLFSEILRKIYRIVFPIR